MNPDEREWLEGSLAACDLSQAGEVELVKQRAWATVTRVPTSGGDVYFKANAPGGRHEPALTSALSTEWPDRVPTPLAIETERGWLLTPDRGQRLSDVVEERDLVDTWMDLLPRYAEIQLASALEPERWLALGVPDRRLEKLPEQAESLVRESVDLSDTERSLMLASVRDLEARCRDLAALPRPAALEHGDLHGANVLVGRGASWFFDWADSSVSHPFSTLLVTCNMATEDLDSQAGRRDCARLRDAYLEPWSALAPIAELRQLFPAALWVAHVGRALDWDHMLRGTDAPDATEWKPRIARWLRLWLERREWIGTRPWP